MAHIHELIDFIANAYIVNDNRILLIKHKELGLWLPIGGHIELNEDPEEALYREVKEECGLEIELLSLKTEFNTAEFKSLPMPFYLDIHKIKNNHRHVAFEYVAKAKTNDIKLNELEHDDIKWFSKEDLDDPQYNLKDNVKFLAKKALELERNA